MSTEIDDKIQQLIYGKIENLLRSNSSKSFSREEILNLLSNQKDDPYFEQILAEIEVLSIGNRHNIHVSCQGGTVYFKWQQP